jgi:hypothetical protein
MIFTSKTEAYSYAIFLLNLIKENYLNKNDFQVCIEKIKLCFENHEQDQKLVCSILEELAKQTKLNDSDLDQVNKLIEGLQSSNYNQPLAQKLENPLARRAESELPILLIQQPTKAMMIAVSKISEIILHVIEEIENSPSIHPFLSLLNENSDVIAFGAFKNTPKASEVEKILYDNNPMQLPEIMHIHYKFAYGVFRKHSFTNMPNRAPIGKLAEIIGNIWEESNNLGDFFGNKGIGNSSETGKYYRKYISDIHFCESELYTSGTLNRGRREAIASEKSYSQLGLMLPSQADFALGFPLHASSWVPDCKCQLVHPQSRYVLDLIENDAIYISGPSGMASLLLGQMEVLGNFETIELKQHYLSATVGYIVGGGFHSLHEVIGPAEYLLNLVPGYKVQPPIENGKKAPPPNFNVFFQQQIKIDPEFLNLYQQAWDNYLSFFHNVYIAGNNLDLSATQTLNTYMKSTMNVGSFIKQPSSQAIFKSNESSSSLNSSYLSPVSRRISVCELDDALLTSPGIIEKPKKKKHSYLITLFICASAGINEDSEEGKNNNSNSPKESKLHFQKK